VTPSRTEREILPLIGEFRDRTIMPKDIARRREGRRIQVQTELNSVCIAAASWRRKRLR
jgi:hypothetical protein